MAKAAKVKPPKHRIDSVDSVIVLEGPQINGPAISQADIDSLFDYLAQRR